MRSCRYLHVCINNTVKSAIVDTQREDTSVIYIHIFGCIIHPLKEWPGEALYTVKPVYSKPKFNCPDYKGIHRGSLPLPAWAEGTVLSLCVCVCVCLSACLFITTKLL